MKYVLETYLLHLFTWSYVYLGENAMAPHSSTVARKIPWMEEPGRPQSIGSLRVRHDWATSLSLSTFMHWRRKWQPTPVFLPGESQGQRSLVGCSPWGRTELDMTEASWRRRRLSKWLGRVFSSTTIWKHQFFHPQPSLWSTSLAVEISFHGMIACFLGLNNIPLLGCIIVNPLTYRRTSMLLPSFGNYE